MLDIKRFHYCEQTHTNEQYTRIVTIVPHLRMYTPRHNK